MLDRTPVDTLSVDGTMSGDGDILQFGTIDERVAFLGTIAEGVVLLHIEFLIGRTQNNRVVRKVQIQVANQLNRTGKPFAIGYDEVTAALFFQVFERLSEGFGVIRHAVTNPTEIHDIDRVLRDDHRLHVLNGTRQIGVVLVIRILGESGYAYERQDRKKEFFHIRF